MQSCVCLLFTGSEGQANISTTSFFFTCVRNGDSQGKPVSCQWGQFTVDEDSDLQLYLCNLNAAQFFHYEYLYM